MRPLKLILITLVFLPVLTASGLAAEWFLGHEAGLILFGVTFGIAILGLLIVGVLFWAYPERRARIRKLILLFAMILVVSILSFVLTAILSRSLPIYRGEDEGLIL